MPTDPAIPPSTLPEIRSEERLSALERQSRVPAVARETHVFYGQRTDLPAGWGPRVRIGLLSDGSYGVERWTSSGTRQVPTWS